MYERSYGYKYDVIAPGYDHLEECSICNLIAKATGQEG